jgi:hypothetical protein
MQLISPGSKVICLVPSIDEKLATCAEMLALKGVSVHIVLITLAGDRSAEEIISHSALFAGTSITVVECSTASVLGTVTYEYAA